MKATVTFSILAFLSWILFIYSILTGRENLMLLGLAAAFFFAIFGVFSLKYWKSKSN